MKKFLLMAMVAVAFMACNENGASVPSSDKKAVKAVTTDAVSMVGQEPAKVEKFLTSAGFTKVEATDGIAKVSARYVRAPKAKAAEEVSVQYVYNLPTDYQSMDEAAGAQYVQNLLDKGECLVMVITIYKDNKLMVVSTNVFAPLKDNINLLYTQNSDGLFAQLPAPNGTTSFWQGGIRQGEKSYTDHAEYVAAIAAAKAISAEEQGYAIKNLDPAKMTAEGFGFYCLWENPDEAERAAMLKEDGIVGAMGSFSVMDYAYALEAGER